MVLGLVHQFVFRAELLVVYGLVSIVLFIFVVVGRIVRLGINRGHHD